MPFLSFSKFLICAIMDKYWNSVKLILYHLSITHMENTAMHFKITCSVGIC